eukprot:gene21168-28064_t
MHNLSHFSGRAGLLPCICPSRPLHITSVPVRAPCSTHASNIINKYTGKDANFDNDNGDQDEASGRRPPQPPSLFRNLNKLREGGGRIREDIEVIGFVKPEERATVEDDVADSNNDGKAALAARMAQLGFADGLEELDGDDEDEDAEDEDDVDEDD